MCAGALYVLSVVNNEDFLNEVCKKGDYLCEKLLKIDGVKSVRHRGLMVGIELELDNAKDMAAKCTENGLLIITAKNLLRMLPPLNITYEEIDKAVEILKAVLPNSSIGVNADLLSDAEIHTKLQEGYDDMKAGRVQNAADAFNKFRENH